MTNNMSNPIRKKDPLNEFDHDLLWAIGAYILRALLLILAFAIFSLLVRIK